MPTPLFAEPDKQRIHKRRIISCILTSIDVRIAVCVETSVVRDWLDDQQKKIRLILVDDHPTIHEEIGALLQTLEDIELVGQAYNGEEAVRLCASHNPEIVLMDVSMPVMNGLAATKAIHARDASIRVIALSGIDDAQTVQQLIAAGAVGYILKEAHPSEIVNTIRAVHRGTAVFSMNVLKRRLDRSEVGSDRSPSAREYALTRREIEVLVAMSRGLNNSQVAAHHNISTSTVRFHLTNIIEKLEAANRSEALVIAARNHLI